ncbi:MAG: hypothetical protein NZ824_01250 [Candidatus Thioglobus sp.]|nr:hypothetical protein [Candidatus Thioglobus sp.]
MSNKKNKFKLSSLTSKSGLITGSILGIVGSVAAAYYLVPIFEKSEENAVEIVKVNENLEKTEDALADTSNELKETHTDLKASKVKIESLSHVESDLKTAKGQISELEEASQKDGAAIGELQEQVETQDENIQALTKTKEKLNGVIADNRTAIKKRAEWIKDLENHDDIVIKNATNLVENFMKISDSRDEDMNSRSKDKLLIDTLSLVTMLESRLNKRRIFLEELSEKIKED